MTSSSEFSFILWFLDYTYQNLLVQKEEKKLKYFNFDSEDQRQEVLSAHGLGSCSAYRSKRTGRAEIY